MKLDILFENENLLVINKTKNMVVHSGVKIETPTLVDLLVEKYPSLKLVGEHYEDSFGKTVLRSGIVHRLDKDTTGVMIVAKTQVSFDKLKKAFQDKVIRKEYRALVIGIPKRKRGTIRTMIGRSRVDFRKRTVKNPRGELRNAITEYVVKAVDKKNKLSYLALFPLTGRMHQLRVHAKAILHTPILGDKKYGTTAGNLVFKDLALHSYRILIPESIFGKEVEIVAPIPKAITNMLNDKNFEKV